MAGEFIEFFTELMFGSGAWIGLMLILGFMFVVAYKVRLTSVLWIFILLFLNLEYWGQIGGEISIESNFMWSIIITYLAMVLMAAIFIDFLFEKRRG